MSNAEVLTAGPVTLEFLLKQTDAVIHANSLVRPIEETTQWDVILAF